MKNKFYIVYIQFISSFECVYLYIVQNSIQTVVIQRIVEFRSKQKTSYRYFTTKMSLRNSIISCWNQISRVKKTIKIEQILWITSILSRSSMKYTLIPRFTWVFTKNTSTSYQFHFTDENCKIKNCPQECKLMYTYNTKTWH